MKSINFDFSCRLTRLQSVWISEKSENVKNVRVVMPPLQSVLLIRRDLKNET